MNDRVVVVGAGPAGAAAAITLARAGVAVTVLDRARFPRDKCCGDGLTTGALHRLDLLGLDPATVGSFTEISTLHASSPSGRMVEVPLARPGATYATVACRVDLDAALVRVAKDAGAEVIEGELVSDVRAERAGVTVVSEGGVERTGKAVLAADGARSSVRRIVRGGEGASPDEAGRLAGRDSWLAYRQYASGVSERASNELWVRFDPALLPGYGWSFPVGDGTANVGIGRPRAPGTAGADLRRAWESALRSPFFSSLLGTAAKLEGNVRAWPIPTGVRAADLSALDGRVLFLGDAAATADPFTGEGIAQALESGILAARAVIGEPEDPATTYTSSIAKAFFLEHRIARATRSFFSRELGARAAIHGTGLGPKVAAVVGAWLYEGYPRTVLARPELWRRSTFNQPGPYSKPSSSGAA